MTTTTKAPTFSELVIKTHTEPDPSPDLSYLDQTEEEMGEGWQEFATERKAAYKRDEWSMLGVITRATFYLHGTRQTISAAGLWGVESDSDPGYFPTIAEEQRHELADHLAAIGIPAEMIIEAMTDAQQREERDNPQPIAA